MTQHQQQQHQHLYFGLDLGKRKDYSALALVEYSRPFITYRNPVTYEMDQEFEDPRYAVRQLTRIPLGTKYVDVVEQIRAILAKAVKKNYDCTLIVDATGVGQPVVEMFQDLPPRAKLVPVVITGGTPGAGSSRTRDEWHVPKQDLITGLQIMLETGALQIANGLPFSNALLEELLEFRGGQSPKGNEWSEGPQDDLVLATALAAWRARRHEPPGSKNAGFKNKDIGIYAVGTTPSGWGTTRLF